MRFFIPANIPTGHSARFVFNQRPLHQGIVWIGKFWARIPTGLGRIAAHALGDNHDPCGAPLTCGQL